jgi:crotonobetainyl-CoA:carnitine CoA-transferase CaiB-like acyl-CoA transferase
VGNRVANRHALDEAILTAFSRYTQPQLLALLETHQIAYGRLNTIDDVLAHPQRRTVSVQTPVGMIELTASGVVTDDNPPVSLPVPALGEHTDKVKAEFSNKS